MRVIVPVLSIFVVIGATRAEDAAKKEMTHLEGQWSMVSGEANGMSMPKEIVDGGKRVAKDGETTITIAGRVYFTAKFSIDSTKKPKTIDYAMTEGPTKGKTHLGIYELDGAPSSFALPLPGKSARPNSQPRKAASKP